MSLHDDIMKLSDHYRPCLGSEESFADAYAAGHRDARHAAADLAATHASQQAAVVAGLEDYLEAQDALDNREAAGINAEDYFVLLRRRNFARDCLDKAIAAASDHAMKEQP